ncbi:hypothetical protein Klosneuvirus_3_8 [Klosneuvirus KNV1]|uniref:GIY-YIG domain-containing protein n=1 Tax=Klosneuvirus KNV1 TaxID=1977640 RepID=A0A1V0SJI6_9VIRU|nr:hypothetical protein Klosneuvirus_3_8 [Klosneuvirus KNV1]
MIYVLLLEKDKWYVGYTDRKDGERFTEHFTGNGSKWTQLYKPVQVMEWRKGTLEDENTVTLEFMEKYGWWNVRGGSYCNVEMSKPPKQLTPKLPKSITTTTKMKTPNIAKIQVKPPESPINTTKRIFKNGYWRTIKVTTPKTNKNIANTDELNCSRCGNDGHTQEKCYAKKDINDDDIDDECDYNIDSESLSEELEWICSGCNKSFETKKGALYHQNFYCKHK